MNILPDMLDWFENLSDFSMGTAAGIIVFLAMLAWFLFRRRTGKEKADLKHGADLRRNMEEMKKDAPFKGNRK